jgi:hypothetical protein
VNDERSRPLPPIVNSREVITFVDSSFVVWRVVERDARADPGHRASRCLIFSSPEAVRRVWNYPAGWRALDDAALEALSWLL